MDIERSPRQNSVLHFIQLYMLEHGGRAPTLKEMLLAKVGFHTPAGAITSKSVLRYNLQRLEERGDLDRIDDGSSRNLSVPGGVYTIPFNVMQETTWMQYEIILLDIDDFEEGHLPDKAVEWCRHVYDDDNKILFTGSTLRFDCDVWERIDLNSFMHISKTRPYEVVNEIVHQGYNPETVAVISQQLGMQLATVGFGLALFDHETVHGCAPNTDYHVSRTL